MRPWPGSTHSKRWSSSRRIDAVCSGQEYQHVSRNARSALSSGDHARWSPVNRKRSARGILARLAQSLTDGQPEAATLLRGLAQVGTGFGLLLAGERLALRQTDAPATLLDGEHEHLDLAPRRVGLA